MNGVFGLNIHNPCATGLPLLTRVQLLGLRVAWLACCPAGTACLACLARGVSNRANYVETAFILSRAVARVRVRRARAPPRAPFAVPFRPSMGGADHAAPTGCPESAIHLLPRDLQGRRDETALRGVGSDGAARDRA